MIIPNSYKIKRGQRVYITLTNNQVPITDALMLIESDISLKISTEYAPLTNFQTSPAFTALTSSITALRNRGWSGAFAKQGFQVWSNTKPMEFSIPIELRMTSNAYLDVMKPSQEIIKLSVPEEVEGRLIPPGPSLVNALGLDADEYSAFSGGESTMTIQIANYIYIPNCVITQAVPTYSKELDENGMPISCKLDCSFITTEVVTKQMIGNLTQQYAIT